MDRLCPWNEVLEYGFVFVQLMERPRPLQHPATVSSMALRSSHESATKAMASVSVFKVSDDCLQLQLLPVTHKPGISMEVGHAHASTLHLMVCHTNGHIRV